MVPSTTDTIADNPPPPSPRPLPPPPVSPSLNLSWCQSAKGGRRGSLSVLLARFQTLWQRCKMAVGGVWILGLGRFVKAALELTAQNDIWGKLTIWFADETFQFTYTHQICFLYDQSVNICFEWNCFQIRRWANNDLNLQTEGQEAKEKETFKSRRDKRTASGIILTSGNLWSSWQWEGN